MNKAQVLKINKERLDEWANDLADHHATPLITIAIGHDHHVGEIHICTVNEKEMDRAMMAKFVEFVHKMLVDDSTKVKYLGKG